LHLVSAFAADSGLILGQRATSQKSNEKTAIPELLATLALEGCTVTIDAMGTQPDDTGHSRSRAHYLLAIKETSRSWPKRSMTSLTPFWTAILPGYPMRTSSMSRRTMAGWRFVAAMFSTNSSACHSQNAGQDCALS
jgi:predicted transposase YbfD/YdcC